MYMIIRLTQNKILPERYVWTRGQGVITEER